MPGIAELVHCQPDEQEVEEIDEGNPEADRGEIVEQNAPAEFFDNPQHERTKLFLSQILH